MFKLVTKVNGDETDWAFGADQCWGIHTLWSAISYRSKSAAYNFFIMAVCAADGVYSAFSALRFACGIIAKSR